MLNLSDFSRFCNSEFHLPLRAQELFEPRKEPDIPISQLFRLIVGGLALRKKSFHQIDLFARTDGAKKWLGSKRPMVASDATFWRVLPVMDRSQLREFVRRGYELLRKKGHGTLRLPSGRLLRAAAVDGTTWGGRYASAVEILGKPSAVIDFEPALGKGHELAASEIVLRRLAKSLNKGFVDIVLGDGLYITKEMLGLCRNELGTHLLVKTKELESLNILKDAEALFAAGGEFEAEVEHRQGTDLGRGLSYQIWAAGGFHHAGFKDDLKVARVKTKPLKGEAERETFWIVTTDLTLSAEDMRELAHLRWSIENHGFRALNEAMNSKHVWTRGAKAAEVFEALMLMMLLSFMLVVAFHAELEQEKLFRKCRIRRLTLKQLAQYWLMSIHEAGGLFALAG